MTPAFALDLALDGIRLLFKADGGWTVVGDVSLDSPDFDDRLAALRDEAESVAPDRLTTELIIPPSQIRYADLPRESGQPITEATLRPRLAGLTPLDPDELVFDWDVRGDTIRLAVLDRTTLNEAEAFADAHGFRPVCFSARPAADEFPRNPDFGATSMADTFETAERPPPVFASRRAGSLPPAAPAERVGGPPPAAALPLSPDLRTDTGAADIARSLGRPAAEESGTEAESLTLFGLRGRPSPESEGRAADARLKIAAAVGLAAVVWLAYFAIRGDGPSDPAAVLPDTPPAVALEAPGLAQPETRDLAIAAPPEATDPATLAAPNIQGVTGAEPDSPGALADGVTAPPEKMTDEDPALRYAATGIWAEGPDPTAAPPGIAANTDELYIASIDPVTRSSDAIALPQASAQAEGPRPAAPLPPPPAGTTFEFDADGAVVATPQGAWTPDGLVVVLGRPALVPPPAPARPADLGLPPSETAAALPDRRPLPRPGGLIERNERATLGGLTRNELSRRRPEPRPRSEQATALAELGPEADPSEFAVEASAAPRARPENFATRVATQRAVAAALAEAATQTPTAAIPDEADDEPDVAVASTAPNIPTSASVARQATIENAIRLRDLNLIGVYGTEGNRRALVRLPSGRYVKVQVGDRLDGGQIAAIGRNQLRYVKGGRNITLTVPSG